MPVRRHHEKSRHGCIQCKSRKVKCDEAKPVCGGCGKRGAKCSFEDATSSFVFVSEFNGPNSSKLTATSTSSPPAQNTLARPDISNLAITGPNETIVPPIQNQHQHPGHRTLPSIDVPLSANSLGPFSSPRHVDTPPPAPPVPTNPAPSEALFSASERDNIQLMRYYTLFVYKQINGDTKQFSMWRDYVPELAFQNDYLLHMILATSALYMALSEAPASSTTTTTTTAPTPSHAQSSSYSTPASAPSPTSTIHTQSSTSSTAPASPASFLSASPAALALHHHQQGLSLFRPLIPLPINSTNIQPLFAFAALLATFGFGAGRANISLSPPDILPEIIHNITMLRHVGSIVKQGPNLLQASPLHALLLPMPSDPYAPLSPRLEAAIVGLRQRNALVNAALPDVKEAYDGGIDCIRTAFLLALEHPGSGMVVVPFTIFLPDRAAQGMRAGEPMALLLLGYYAVLLHQLGMQIWLKGLGKRVVRAVWEEVGEEWREALTWAVDEVGL